MFDFFMFKNICTFNRNFYNFVMKCVFVERYLILCYNMLPLGGCNVKIVELRESGPLEVIRVSKHTTYILPEPVDGIGSEETVKNVPIEMMVFTDGVIERECDKKSTRIDEYYIGKKKFEYDVDTLETKNVYFKDFSFIISYLIGQELCTVGNVKGWFSVVKELKIYVKNIKDKRALKNAKRAIKAIKNYNNSVNYSSLFTMMLSQGRELQEIEIEEISDNIYTLKRN